MFVCRATISALKLVSSLSILVDMSEYEMFDFACAFFVKILLQVSVSTTVQKTHQAYRSTILRLSCKADW